MEFRREHFSGKATAIPIPAGKTWTPEYDFTYVRKK